MNNHVAIIGTGFGGIATAVRLQQAGFDDLVLIDRAGDVGGVWRDNSYPGPRLTSRVTCTRCRSRRTLTGTTHSRSSPSCTPTRCLSRDRHLPRPSPARGSPDRDRRPRQARLSAHTTSGSRHHPPTSSTRTTPRCSKGSVTPPTMGDPRTDRPADLHRRRPPGVNATPTAGSSCGASTSPTTSRCRRPSTSSPPRSAAWTR